MWKWNEFYSVIGIGVFKIDYWHSLDRISNEISEPQVGCKIFVSE